MLTILLRVDLNLIDFKFGILALLTAFIVALLSMPPLIKIIQHFQLFDIPDLRKEHATPVPTMGGIAICLGLAVACLLWFRFNNQVFVISFFFSVAVLFAIGIMDDLKNLPARYKLVIQMAAATLIALSGVRITSFNGLFGIYELTLPAQYSFTILAITGVTNAFNLIDGIDGLAGGLGFMSLTTLGLFLTLCGDSNSALIAFALSGGLLGFLYYNLNPARIFMGDTGSLVLGFVISVLCIRLIQLNAEANLFRVVRHAPVLALSIVVIPVFDTLRVFALRIWQGKSPFAPDKNHIHHLLTNNGWSHGFAAKLILGLHALVLITGYFLKSIPQTVAVVVLFVLVFVAASVFRRIKDDRLPAAVDCCNTPL